MKNKIITLCLALLLTTSLAACGKMNTQNPQNSQTQQETQNKDNDKDNNKEDKKENKGDKQEEGYKKYDELPSSLQVVNKDTSFSIDLPNDQIVPIQSGYKIDSDNYVLFCNSFEGEEASKIKEPKDILESTKEQLVSILDKIIIPSKEYKLTIKDSENVKINKYDMIKQKGQIDLKGDNLKYKSTSFVSYATIKSKTPLYFMLIDKEGNLDNKRLEEEALKVANTFKEGLMQDKDIKEENNILHSQKVKLEQ